MSDSESENDRLSIESPAPEEEVEPVEDIQETEQLNSVRNSIRDWKLREMDANTNGSQKSNGLGGLRNYVSKSAKLYYDLMNYIQTSKNDENNMKDSFYVSIVQAIGIPTALPFSLRMLLEHVLQRDLLELPFTVEPTVINSYAKKGYSVQTEFPDEE